MATDGYILAIYCTSEFSEVHFVTQTDYPDVYELIIFAVF